MPICSVKESLQGMLCLSTREKAFRAGCLPRGGLGLWGRRILVWRGRFCRFSKISTAPNDFGLLEHQGNSGLFRILLGNFQWLFFWIVWQKFPLKSSLLEKDVTRIQRICLSMIFSQGAHKCKCFQLGCWQDLEFVVISTLVIPSWRFL